MDRLNLITFAAVARNGSVSAAAEELHTVQSNVTKRLKGVIKKIGEQDAELGAHLESSIKTGIYTIYRPAA